VTRNGQETAEEYTEAEWDKAVGLWLQYSITGLHKPQQIKYTIL